MALRDLRKSLAAARKYTASADVLARAGACDAAGWSASRARRALARAQRAAGPRLAPTVTLARASLASVERKIARCVRR